jgi:hypothetical protein
MQTEISSSVASVLLLPYLIAELTFGFADITIGELGRGSVGASERRRKNEDACVVLSPYLPCPRAPMPHAPYATLANGEINFTSVFNLTK